MPLFKLLPSGRTKSGLAQEVYCPRCKEELEGQQEFVSGEGTGIRKTLSKFVCNECGYSIEVVERYPLINRVKDGAQHAKRITS